MCWLAGAVLAVAVAVAPPGGPVAYAASSTTCTGTSTISYQPGLTNTPQQIHYHETDTYSTCISTNPTLTHGSASASTDLSGAYCNHTPGVFTDPGYTITWNNGQHSTINLTFTDAIINGTEQVTGTGTVIDGKFQGGNATIVWIYPILNLLQCSTAQGVTSQTGTVTAQITTL